MVITSHRVLAVHMRGVVAVIVNVVLNLALYKIMGHVGLALATSAAATVNAYLLWRGLYRTGRCRPSRESGITLIRCLIATLAMVLVLVWLTPADKAWLQTTIMDRALWLAGCVLAGAGVYLLGIWVLGGRISHLLHRA